MFGNTGVFPLALQWHLSRGKHLAIFELSGLYTLTNTKKRKHQLKDLLLECARFKLRLERQASVYFFRWSCPGTPFLEERMRSLTEVSSTETTVSQRIWPMHCKGISDNWITVEKEVVQPIEPDPCDCHRN
ncbi:hypothetical protein N7481_013355 [Penicillium waksmanii]|uniref:uncharacterized protein n=1 Tax=Penicillium waksmanii TaxID=69791 RepID=UPI002548F9E1|nr:uncharacterized protein N7481_013355 [Penicillium waksmanii]KAJ5963050.1 hypothetical protein N7481_013355 [Penicillium waksmanii]